MAKKWRRMLPVVAYIVLIFVVSSIPTLPAPGPEFLFRDKLAHFVEYFILGLLLFRSVRWNISASGWATFGFLVSVAATIGALNEFCQSFVPGREMSIGDWFADTAGAVAGVALFTFTPFGGSPPVTEDQPLGTEEGRQT
jgi:VanZ family protein